MAWVLIIMPTILIYGWTSACVVQDKID